MAGIQLGSGFDLNSPIPLDSRTQVENIAGRDAIPTGNRYEGLLVYVKADKKYYSLAGGVANTNWSEMPTAQALAQINTALASTVKKVNGVAPSTDGNVTIQVSGNIDTTNLATKDELKEVKESAETVQATSAQLAATIRENVLATPIEKVVLTDMPLTFNESFYSSYTGAVAEGTDNGWYRTEIITNGKKVFKVNYPGRTVTFRIIYMNGDTLISTVGGQSGLLNIAPDNTTRILINFVTTGSNPASTTFTNFANLDEIELTTFTFEETVTTPKPLLDRVVELEEPLKNKRLKVLCIGNSFAQSMMENLAGICNSVGLKVTLGNTYMAGMSLERHWNNSQSNAATYTFQQWTSEVPTTTPIPNTTLEYGILKEEWDYIVFQQSSPLSGEYNTFQPFLNDLMGYVKGKMRNPNTQFALHMTWAYSSKYEDADFARKYQSDPIKMYNAIVDAYKQAMKETGIKILIPNGTAIENARTNPELKALGNEMTNDGYHLDPGIPRLISSFMFFESVIAPLFKKDLISEVDYSYASNNSRYLGNLGKIAVKNAQINPFKITEADSSNVVTKAELAVKANVEEVAKLTNGMQLGSRMALMSDSIGQAPFYSGNPGGLDETTRLRGETWITSASIASHGRIRVGLNVAVSGNTTAQMLERIDTDLGAKLDKWDTLVVCGGVNDVGITPKQTSENIEAMARKALSWGKNVVFCTLFPANNHEHRVRIRKINYFVTALAAKYHAPLIDFHSKFLDPTTAGWKAGMFHDALHPNLVGANEAGKFFAEKIVPFVPDAQPFLALDNLDHRVMINGFNYNPLWLTDSDGNGVPDGFAVDNVLGGYTFTWDNDPTFDTEAKRCNIVGIQTAKGPVNVNAAFAAASWTVGDVCQVALRVRVKPGTAGDNPPKFALRVVAVGSTEGFGFQQELRGAHDGVIVSEPFTIPTGTTAFRNIMEVSGGAIEVDIARPTLINLTRQGML